MDLGIDVVALLVVAWLLCDVVVVAVALLGTRAKRRRVARTREEAPPASVVSLATLRALRSVRRSSAGGRSAHTP